MKVQLTPNAAAPPRSTSACCARASPRIRDFAQLEFSFDSGGLVRGALNEGKSSPINIQLVGKNQDVLFRLADKIKEAVKDVDGIVEPASCRSPTLRS